MSQPPTASGEHRDVDDLVCWGYGNLVAGGTLRTGATQSGMLWQLVRVRSTISFDGSNEQPTRLPRSLGDALSGVDTATAVSTDMPGLARAALASRGLNRMRTVKRLTIFVKLPVALSGGISANSDPAAGKIAST